MVVLVPSVLLLSGVNANITVSVEGSSVKPTGIPSPFSHRGLFPWRGVLMTSPALPRWSGGLPVLWKSLDTSNMVTGIRQWWENGTPIRAVDNARVSEKHTFKWLAYGLAGHTSPHPCVLSN